MNHDLEINPDSPMIDDAYRAAFPPHRFDTTERHESMCSYTALPPTGGLSVYCPFPPSDQIHRDQTKPI